MRISIKHLPSVVPVLALLLSSFNADANPTQTEIDISGLVNTNLSNDVNGFFYPVGPASITYGGRNFALSGAPANDPTNSGPPYAGLGAIQSTLGNGGQGEFLIPVNQKLVSTIYTISDSTNGVSGAAAGSLIFKFARLTNTFIYPLIVGNNIANTIVTPYSPSPPNAGSLNFGGNYTGAVWLYVQTITLPPAFSDRTLTSISFDGAGNGSFLVAATTASVPEAPTWAMIILGLAGLGAALRVPKWQSDRTRRR